ncbi:MAG: hypothetical protein EBU90_25655 [Proteobacteria bacterium]|nr:hypothetical protein [Pseudomonadota bacterium]
MINREKAIETLIRDDVNTVTDFLSNNDTWYLEDILRTGFRGYQNYTNSELITELAERFEDSFKLELYEG